MNLQRLALALTVALVVSAACTYLLGRKLAANASRQRPDLRYAAPATALTAGEVLKSENLQMVPWPATHAIAGAFERTEDLAGRTLLYPVDKGQPISEKYVTVAGAGLGLAGRIPAGMRAVSLRSDEVMGVGGFLLPGSRLDVLLTYRPEHAGEPATITVLQDAVVLAAGHQVQPDPESKPSTTTVVTLLLTPTDAERAVLASTQGTMHFVLRGGSDRNQDQKPAVLLSQLSGEPRHEAPSPAPKMTGSLVKEKPLRPRTPEVETILGDRPAPASVLRQDHP